MKAFVSISCLTFFSIFSLDFVLAFSFPISPNHSQRSFSYPNIPPTYSSVKNKLQTDDYNVADSPSLATKKRHPSKMPQMITSDEDFISFLESEINVHPGTQTQYQHIYQLAIQAILKWRTRFHGNPKLWKRLFDKKRILKELIEAAPIIDAVQKIVSEYTQEEPFTIVDLASGKGFLSMFLSEMLPPNKVEGILLIDKAWPMRNHSPKSHHINWDHIYGSLPNTTAVFSATYFDTWPIPMHTSKQDLKQTCTKRQMKQNLFDTCKGPILILAIHLCGTLSLKAVEMFNDHDNVSFLALKPCCLPRMVHANRGDIFQIGNHSFPATQVCSPGYFVKKQWNGPPRWHLEKKFHLWSENLFKGIDIEEFDSKSFQLNRFHDEELNGDSVTYQPQCGKKEKHFIEIQVDGGFQNTYIFAERSPLTSPLWMSLQENKCKNDP